ncbi:hypothetical protein RB195_003304 [Necator americanus]|uniref:Kunitz/Bovine pancreatic trypsin inhibitor domain protein n=1 Tax=Necator americanus TaxID=51031 RepID=A0ABR1DPF2_NECAM
MSSSTVCHTQPVDAGNTSNIDHAHLTVATPRRLAPPTQVWIVYEHEAKLCAIGERCATVGGVAKCMQNFDSSRHDCPRIIGGICTIRCDKDSDCSGNRICCPNGCGRECMSPLGRFHIEPDLAIKPVQSNSFHQPVAVISAVPTRSEPIRPTNTTLSPVSFQIDRSRHVNEVPAAREKIGMCPPGGDEKMCSTYAKCSHDFECMDVEKCCTNVCGTVCVNPTKATNCAHFVIAVKRLPEQKLRNGYIPKCDERGKFAPIQCDQRQCWCVDVNYGTEIAGSAVGISMKRGDMCRELRLCGVKCSKQCPHGLKMTVFGCPDPSCECKDICEDVRCSNGADTCQLIEPDCSHPPCLPVPRCLINPCPSGPPMTLHNGVTALCATSDQCTHDHWCHKIGYNGLGFCCNGPKIPKRAECPAVMPLKDGRCSSTCSTDHDCPNGKCCFDGCGLTCYPLQAPGQPLKSIVPQRKVLFKPADVARHNKACFHFALTTELYQIRKAKRCDRAGKFEPIQCDDDGCFCVDIGNGEEVTGTRTSNDAPNCKTANACPEMICRTACPYDFEKEPNGCPSCRCKNPCAEVKCPQGSFCIMAAVSCFQTENCPPQPRCVLNLCPRGEPHISPVGVVETCSADDQCPSNFWCHQVGFSSSGICCPSPSRHVHNGICPAVAPLLDRAGVCRFDCRADDDCAGTEKCCYDGCGMRCKEVFVSGMVETGEGRKQELVKPGVCPYFDERQCRDHSQVNQCGSDEDCAGVQKCCSDGCTKKCLYPENNSACMQAKAALQMIGQATRIQCRPDGSFEEVQCDSDYCWCVNQYGVEVEGTRISDDIAPNCRSPRKCPIPLCTHDIFCKFGLRKDSNGCDKCECSSPCDGVVCPDTSVCVPAPVECVAGPCPEVPRCVVNPCLSGSPLVDSSTAQHIKCTNNSGCVGSNAPAYCSHYKNDRGVCCPGKEPHWSPGTCPQGILSNGDCSRQCLLDEQCAPGQKCCFNGCGLSCVAAVFSAPPPPTIHVGDCLETKHLGAFCVQRAKDSECSVDTDCPSLRKCCSDGCVRRCVLPDVTTHCIHARLAALAIRDSFDNSAHVPDCDSNGEYLQVQSHYALKWCVDKHGKEVPGTKSTTQPNCKLPRSCPVRACNKHCPFGLRTDNDGCSLCDCVTPCDMVQCQAGFVCRMVEPRCYTKECAAVPRCIPNSCPSGEPLILTHSGVLVECSGGKSCPAGYFCSQSGYEGRGFCCGGVAPAPPSISCPPFPITANPVDSSTCVISCRRPSDCIKSVCCFNGCGTSCQFETGKMLAPTGPPATVHILPTESPRVVVSVDNGSQIQPADKMVTSSSVDWKAVNVPVVYPQRTFAINPVQSQKKHPIIPGFPNSAVAVIDSAGSPPTMGSFQKPGPISAPQKVGTCPSLLLNPGCREECLTDADCVAFSKCCKASCGTKCVEPTVTSTCLHRLAAFSREWPHLPPPVQCSANGEFREMQCNFKTRQCWCVDSSGVELIGTRTANDHETPQCKRPKICSVSCTHSSCTYGVQLDANGCPHDGVCLCRNPCDDFTCSSRKTCALVTVKCDRSPCLPVPKCIATPCYSKNLITDLYGNAFSCRSGDCPRGECLTAVGEDVGVCCQMPETTTTPEHLMRKSNCILYRAAVEELRRRNAVDMPPPTCDPNTGLFSRIQCDNSGTCWCVDVESGRETPGTRREKSVGQNVCEGSRICPRQCPSTLCPYGLALDKDGCPLYDCGCTSPCDPVTCKAGEVCVLRTPQCSSTSTCIPIPTCENSPCNVGDRPAVDPRTKRQFSCRESGEICPTGFYCTGFDPEGTGVCCPGREPLVTKAKVSSCPHGDPFASSSDGTPMACSAMVNTCPSTHFCSAKPGEKIGVCCVSKRHVCVLNPDRGPCSVSVPRYFYSPVNQTCTRFEYGGCAGNLNNFATREHCENFCEGVASDFLTAYHDETSNAVETYELGFSLTGPQIPAGARKRAQQSLAQFLSERFSLPSASIEDVVILDDNTARFTVKDVHASEIAKNISEAVNAGLEFYLNGNYYRAEPHTWFAHQLAERTVSNAAKTVFWILLAAAVLFAVVVVLAFIGTCAYIFSSSRNKDTNSSARGSTPSNFASNSLLSGRPQRRLQLQQESRFPSNATTRSVRSIPQIPSITIPRSRTDTYY